MELQKSKGCLRHYKLLEVWRHKRARRKTCFARRTLYRHVEKSEAGVLELDRI